MTSNSQLRRSAIILLRSSSTRPSVDSSSLAGMITLTFVMPISCCFASLALESAESFFPHEGFECHAGPQPHVNGDYPEAVARQDLFPLPPGAQLRDLVRVEAEAVRFVPAQIDKPFEDPQDALRNRELGRPEQYDPAARLYYPAELFQNGVDLRMREMLHHADIPDPVHGFIEKWQA